MKRTRDDLEPKCGLWLPQPLVVRLEWCRDMLLLSGVLTYAEARAVSRRVGKLSAAYERSTASQIIEGRVSARPDQEVPCA